VLREIRIPREVSMSDELDRAKAEVLLNQLNRRSKLLEIIQDTAALRWSFWSMADELLLGVLLLVAAYTFVQEETFRPYALLLIFCLVVGIEGHIVTLRKRMNALIEILREDGMLQSTPSIGRLLDKQ